MELRGALTQIAEMRLQMARAEDFRGSRAAPVVVTGVLARLAMGLQPVLIPAPIHRPTAYPVLQIGAAVPGTAVGGADMVVRGTKAPSWHRCLTRFAVVQFLPCLVAGALVTAALAGAVPDAIGALPGLWQVLFSLGIFASCRPRPRATFGAGAFDLASGATCLVVARGESALASWAMDLPFGVGQGPAAAVLHPTPERSNGGEP